MKLLSALVNPSPHGGCFDFHECWQLNYPRLQYPDDGGVGREACDLKWPVLIFSPPFNQFPMMSGRSSMLYTILEYLQDRLTALMLPQPMPL